jgi:hypothetical protein
MNFTIPADPQDCLTRFGIMSGRRIRNIVRLAALSAKKSKEIPGLAHLIFAEKFQAVEEKL